MPQRGSRRPSPSSLANPSPDLRVPGSSRCGTCSSHCEFRPFHLPEPSSCSLLELILDSDPASLKPPLSKSQQQVAEAQPFLLLWPPGLHLRGFTPPPHRYLFYDCVSHLPFRSFPSEVSPSSFSSCYNQHSKTQSGWDEASSAYEGLPAFLHCLSRLLCCLLSAVCQVNNPGDLKQPRVC